MEVNLERLSSIFSEAFGEPIVLSINSKKEEIDQWDSINHLNLIVELEDQLDVKFSIKEIESMDSVTELLKILSNK